jgi:hypothetical protein
MVSGVEGYGQQCYITADWAAESVTGQDTVDFDSSVCSASPSILRDPDNVEECCVAVDLKPEIFGVASARGQVK